MLLFVCTQDTVITLATQASCLSLMSWIYFIRDLLLTLSQNRQVHNESRAICTKTCIEFILKWCVRSELESSVCTKKSKCIKPYIHKQNPTHILFLHHNQLEIEHTCTSTASLLVPSSMTQIIIC